MRHETANSIVNALDINAFRKEYETHIDQRFGNLELKFDTTFGDRMVEVED